MFNQSNKTFAGKLVTLKPLALEHEGQLIQAASDGELWNKWTTSVPRPENTKFYIESALEQLQQRQSIPFAVVQNSDGKVIGSTRYCNIDEKNKRLEIGYTWYAKNAQRTGVNTETKQLLLTHAFDVLACIAVEFRTHSLNTQSRNAIMRLGAKQDGLIRNHRVLEDGSYRDTVVYSILESEWPTVKRNLSYMLARHQ